MTPPDLTHRVVAEEFFSLRNLYICHILVCILYGWEGAMFAWSSPLLLNLRSELHTSNVEDMFVVCSCTLGATLGPYVCAMLVNRWGSKSIVWLQVSVFLGSTALPVILYTLPVICFSRFLVGFAIGGVLCHLPTYLDDIKDPEMPMSLLKPGIVGAQTLGYQVVHYQVVSTDQYMYAIGWCLTVIVSVVALVYLPQSPRHAVIKGNLPQARTAIQFLQRGISTNAVETRIRQIEEKISRTQREQLDDMMLLSSRSSKKALSLAMIMSILYHLTGAPVVITVLYDLVTQAQALDNPASAGLVTVFVMGLTAVIPYCRFNQKKRLVGSTILMALSMVLFGLYLLNLEKKVDVSHLNWLPLCCLIVYLASFHIGLAMETDEVIGSLFSWNSYLRQVGKILTVTIGFFMMLIVTIAYFNAGNLFGMKTVVWTFALFSFLTAVFTQFCIPDMSSMRPLDIQDQLNS